MLLVSLVALTLRILGKVELLFEDLMNALITLTLIAYLVIEAPSW